MVARKALPLALDSLAKVTVPATLTIAGNGLSAEEFESLVLQRGLQGRVFWSGRRLDRNEVREAYSTHDALLFTSLRDSCPAQLVEAMGMGLPAFTLDHHGARDLVPNGAGIKVAVSTVEQTASELAAAIDTYAGKSCEEKTSMSQIGWTHARTLNYADGAALLEGLYRQIKAGSRELKGFPSNARHLLNTAVGAKIPAA